MGKRVRASLAMMAVTGLAALLMAAWPGFSAMAQPREQAAQVRTARVEKGRVEQVIAVTGLVRYAEEYALISPAAGCVKQVYVQAGERVSAGQMLARLDTSLQEEAVSSALAAGENLGVLTDALPVSLSMDGTLLQAGTEAAQAAQAMHGMLLRAPSDGLVQQVSCGRWSSVVMGTPIMALSGNEQEIQCSVSPKDAEKLREGLQARIVHHSGMETLAQITEIGPVQTLELTGQRAAQVCLAVEESLDLPLGTQVEVEFLLYEMGNVPVLPLEALTENDTLWWAAEGRCWEIPAQTVMLGEESCWVNLPVGTQVVVNPQGLVQGQRIEEAAP